jgi:hypothetical protein
MKRPLIVAISLICAGPLYAQDQQSNAAKLKADAQRVVSNISGDKAKNQIYCQIADLGDQIDQEKDRKKAEALLQKMDELEKQLGPEYLAFMEATKDVDPNSKDAGEAPASPNWLIKGILPETGAAIMSGQWGAFKTTVALDLSVCVMRELPFAERYSVKRPGAVLYIALEGSGMLTARLSAIAAHHGVSGPLPFAWRDDCPVLTSKSAADALCAIANEAAADLKHRFELPVSLIWIDTLITAAGFASGEDNDAAAAQKVMSALRITSQRTGALVVGIDHFGKVVETGTRGSSAKEGAADTVIAVLADRQLGGGVRNTRLALRKQREGVSGFEIPFAARMVEIGTDDDGDCVTAPVIDWQTTQQTAQADARWTPSMQLLRRVLMAILADCGQKVWPFADGLEVRACNIEIVRAEFYRQYPADGTEQQKAEARRKAFNRSVKESIARGVVASREVDGVQLIWLATRVGANV